MIIFNHEKFMNGPKRRGTALDVAALETTFKQFRFDVTTYNDLTEKDLFTELKKFSSRDFSTSGCLCVAILTHGHDHGYLRAFDTRYCERDVIACFDARLNPSLVAKPIIFLIQACRGRQPASVVEARTINVDEPIQTVELDAVLPSEKYRRPMDSDIIMFHSSFFGRASIRVVEEGTWFIQTLCVQMRLHAVTDHFEKLCRRVRTIVAHMEYEGAKQMPVVTSTLLKKLYLKKTLSSLDKSEKSKEQMWKNALMKSLSRMPRRRKKFDRISLLKAPQGSSPTVIGVYTDKYQTLHVTY
ncbi:caspase-6-like [Cydia amplana]|uniref:caspase-6-like n=1 Tax=Cydia amplana TaxID=1869771 RepID=UPI002FE53E5B